MHHHASETAALNWLSFLRHAAIISTIVAFFGCVPSAGATPCTLIDDGTSKCAFPGSIKLDYEDTYPLYSPQIVNAIEDCASLCGRRRYNASTSYSLGAGNCLSFLYDTSTNLCQLGRTSVDEAVDSKPESTKIFYDLGCFDCGDYCDQPYGAQLLDNGDFQGALFGPWEAVKATAGRGPHHQHYGACLEHASHGYNGGCYLLQTFNMCYKQLYMLEFDYLILTGQSKHAAYMEVGFGPGVQIVERNTNATAWKKRRVYQRTSITEHRYVAQSAGFDFESGNRSYAGHELRLDNVRVSRIPKVLRLKKPVSNVVLNPGFETGKLHPWNTSLHPFTPDRGNWTLVAPGVDSTHGIRFHAHPDVTFRSPYLQQTVRTTPFATYRFSFQALTAVADTLRWILYVDIGAPEFLVTHRLSLHHGNYSYDIPVQVTSSSTLIRLYAYLTVSENATILLDNFELARLAKSKYFP